MTPQVGNIVEFSCDRRKLHGHGQVTRIFRECLPFAEDHILVESQEVSGEKTNVKLWFSSSEITSIISTGSSRDGLESVSSGTPSL